MIVSQLAIPVLEKNSTISTQPRLRDYQIKVVDEINTFLETGKKSVMLVSPTGSGKTLTATDIVKSFVEKGQRVLFIIHREPLVSQTVETLHNYGIESVGYLKAGFPHATDSDSVIVASIQTLARRDYPENIDLVVFDETHTTSFWDTAKDLISYYSQAPVMALSKVKFLHLTATPYRLKRKEYFGNHVEVIVQAPHIGQLIKRGYLVTARHFGYDGLNDFSKLETGSDGDYKKSQVAAVCKEPEYNKAVVNKFLDFCPDRKAISFAASVEQSLLLTHLLNEAGIKAEQIQAETPTELRYQIFERLKTGETQVLSSVGTLTEGFDEPSIEAVILARPTKSLALLIQMCGRGLRLFPDKKDCYLLDFGENFKRLGRVDTKRKISLCPQPPSNTESEKKCPQCQAVINNFCKICPECGYVFPGGERDDDEVFIEGVFGELLDSEAKNRIRYIRTQRKTRFTKGLPPDPLWDLWDKKYPGELLCNDWLYGSVFKGDRSDVAQKLFQDYLLECYPNAKPQWVKFHLELEFNNPRFRSKSKAENSYAVPPYSAIRSWWQVLRIDPLASPQQIREAYQKLASVSQFDDELIHQLNKAFDQAMAFSEISVTQSTRRLLKRDVIEYIEVIGQSEREMERLGWTQQQGIDYLVSRYNKRSRQLLSDEEILEFLSDLTTL
jgi:superfamily II DNA or RNA helicase